MSQYDRKDHFYQKAKKEGYAARSAYKLLEMDERFKIFKPGIKIVDLGCAPGSWMQVAEEKLLVSNKGAASSAPTTSAPPHIHTPAHPHTGTSTHPHIIGIDLLPLHYQPGDNVFFIQGNFLEEENRKKIKTTLGGAAHWVLSDMSPNLSGIAFKDQEASLELVEKAFQFSKEVLKKGGGLVVKIFPGPSMGPLKNEMKKYFKNRETYIPEATRNTSDEVYLVATGFQRTT
ncbi:MAG: hypothetical protein A2048_04585 [Deltaproteobacteria bacterium GWA2_45_12]|nr:MAG: hypothetical protein A2048_04585 [Deltaproteobacteria bacterium GWA2_45_12]